MAKPLVFIGMPVYNGSRHLGEAIESILSQSFSDFVLFISDDASKDGSQALCEGYAARDPRVVYYRQPQNIGMFANFQYVMDKADAPYFMWAAQDDLREPGYVATCVERLEQNPDLGLATTTTALIDSAGNVLAEEHEAATLSGKPSFRQIARYVFQAEGLGKCNLTYGLFRSDVVRAAWAAYPWRKVWGHDYHFALALISRFGVSIDQQVLFKKRLGGYSSPELAHHEGSVRLLSYRDRNNTVPFRRFRSYFRGHMEALRGTPYRPFVAILLFLRLPRSFVVYAGERNYKKYLSAIGRMVS
jgi:glycosyltransferase involved in cell wall biosynthesis